MESPLNERLDVILEELLTVLYSWHHRELPTCFADVAATL